MNKKFLIIFIIFIAVSLTVVSGKSDDSIQSAFNQSSYDKFVLEITWSEDDASLRPDSVSIEIFADDVSFANLTLSKSDSWKDDSLMCPAYNDDGSEVKYTFKQTGADNYTMTSSKNALLDYTLNNKFDSSTAKTNNTQNTNSSNTNSTNVIKNTVSSNTNSTNTIKNTTSSKTNSANTIKNTTSSNTNKNTSSKTKSADTNKNNTSSNNNVKTKEAPPHKNTTKIIKKENKTQALHNTGNNILIVLVCIIIIAAVVIYKKR